MKLTQKMKTVGELEGIDFEAFFDSDNFTHEKTFFENYINQRKNKTSRLRDLHLILPPQNGFKKYLNILFYYGIFPI